MAKCWTCGRKVNGYHYKCPECKNLQELKELKKIISKKGGEISQIEKKSAEFNKKISNQFDYLTIAHQEGLLKLNKAFSEGLAEMASALEWGLNNITWKLQQQTEILRSIDRTLKTPSQTKANEWRLQAEELRHRGVLKESEEFFLKALKEYRLDYRIYVGVAITYIQMSKFDQAKTYLKKSLPHAPKSQHGLKVGKEVLYLLRKGEKIEAIKKYRVNTSKGLKESKQIINKVEKIELNS